MTRTFSCLGGSVTVRAANGSLTLLGTSTASGFSLIGSEARPDRVRVRWESDDASSRIDVTPSGTGMNHTCNDDQDEPDDPGDDSGDDGDDTGDDTGDDSGDDSGDDEG